MNFITSYWWVWLVLMLIFGTISILGWIKHKKQQEELKAQFVITGGCFIGCIFFIFNIVGIISAVLSIISGIFYVFLWWVGK